MKILNTNAALPKEFAPASLQKEINGALLKLSTNLKLLGLPQFGNALVDDCASDPKQITRAVIAYRITNYFERPDNSTAALRRNRTIAKWDDAEARCKLNRRSLQIRSVIYKTDLQEFGKVVLQKLSRINLRDLFIDFGPGESFKSLHGDVGLINKLKPENHTVTHGNLHPWVQVIVSVPGLYKPYVQYWLKNLKPKGYLGLLKVPLTQLVHQVIDSINGYIVYGSRQSFVAKDNENDRDIEVNALGDIVLQKIVGTCFRQAIKDHYNIDLDTAQLHHREVLSSEKVSTIDSSSASNSIIEDHLCAFPPKLQRLILGLTNEYILVRREGVLQYERQYKLCSMGGGFTFELLTTIMHAVALSVAKHRDYVSTYGDDVIVHDDDGEAVVHALTRAGFLINYKKTFLNQPLTESCGAFYLRNFGYIRSYKFTWSDNAVEAVANVNKLRRIVDSYTAAFGSDEFIQLFANTYNSILSTIHPIYLGPIPRGTDIAQWVESPLDILLKRKKKSSVARQIRQEIKPPKGYETLQKLSVDWQYDETYFDQVAICELQPEVTLGVRNKLKYQPLIQSYLYTGRKSQYVNKNKAKVQLKAVLVTLDGILAS